MKNAKKKSAGKNSWVVDCRTDCAFDFALKVLNEADNKKYPFELRANFVKIAYSNSCETIAKAQTNPKDYKLESAFKLFNRNLKRIFSMGNKLYGEKNGKESAIHAAFTKKKIENPFDYIDINYPLIEKYFAFVKNKQITINESILALFAEKYHYPVIYEDYPITDQRDLLSRLLPTNDIIVYLPEKVNWVFNEAAKSTALYESGSTDANSEFIELIKNNIDEIPNPKLIHVPIDSFENISGLINAAANNPDNVDEICITAYRLGNNNKMISDIIKATNNGIRCKIYIELSARGEIDKDLHYIMQLINNANHQYLDVKVQYNGIKVHGKMIYIKLKSNHSIAVFSTGNYNESTATIYKDYHYISCEDSVTDMITRNFSILWNSNQPVMTSISSFIFKEIYEEISKGKDGRIWIQTNHLDNKQIVTLLKEAIDRKCDVKLIVRTTKGFHNRELKNCKSVVGKYLEHSRAYIFGKDDSMRLYLSSSDILFRNLYNRFEAYVKISDTKIQSQIINDFHNLYKYGQK